MSWYARWLIKNLSTLSTSGICPILLGQPTLLINRTNALEEDGGSILYVGHDLYNTANHIENMQYDGLLGP